MTDDISNQIKKMKTMSTSTNNESMKEIINEFLEKDLNILLIDSNYIDHYDRKTKEIIKDHGVKIENFYVLDKNMFLLTLKTYDDVSNLREILKTKIYED